MKPKILAGATLVLVSLVVLAACSSEPTPTPTPTPTPSPKDEYAAWVIRWSTVITSEFTTVGEQLRSLARDPSESNLGTLRLSMGIWERLFFESPNGEPPTEEIARLVQSAQRNFRSGIDAMDRFLADPSEPLEMEVAVAFLRIGTIRALTAKDEAVIWKNTRRSSP